MIVYLIIFILFFFYSSHKLINKITDQKLYKNLNIFFWFIYTLSLLTVYYNKFNISISIFSIGVLISLLVIFKYINIGEEIVNTYSFWGLYVVTVVTVLLTLLTIYYLKSAYYKSSPIGKKGKPGLEGPQGDNSKYLNDIDLCYSQIMHYSNNIFYEWKLGRGYEYDNLDRKIENLYYKQKIKSICQSNLYKELIFEKGIVNAINYLNSEIRNILLFILSYKNGVKFLEDPILNDYSWKELLEKGETKLPFEELKHNKVWNCLECVNYRANLKNTKDSRNKCDKDN